MALSGTWQTVLTLMVRHLINDPDDGDVTYTDTRIQEAITVAGMIIDGQYTFAYDYIFDIAATTISPDPVAKADNAAIALIALKTACILQTNSYQGAVGSSIRVRDGDSEIDTTAGFPGHRDLLKEGPCKAFQDLLEDLQLKGSALKGGLGGAVASPISHYDLTRQSTFSNFGPENTFNFLSSMMHRR